MKMAKAPESEWKKVMEFINDLESEFKYPEKSNEELGKWVRANMPPMHRVCFGYRILVDNCCDPDADTLEWKPEYQAIFDATETKVSGEVTHNSPINCASTSSAKEEGKQEL